MSAEYTKNRPIDGADCHDVDGQKLNIGDVFITVAYGATSPVNLVHYDWRRKSYSFIPINEYRKDFDDGRNKKIPRSEWLRAVDGRCIKLGAAWEDSIKEKIELPKMFFSGGVPVPFIEREQDDVDFYEIFPRGLPDSLRQRRLKKIVGRHCKVSGLFPALSNKKSERGITSAPD